MSLASFLVCMGLVLGLTGVGGGFLNVPAFKPLGLPGCVWGAGFMLVRA